MDAQRAFSARRDEIVEFMARANGDPGQQCLYLDTSAEGIMAQVEDLDQPFEEIFHVLEYEGHLVAVAGMEAEVEVDRAWLLGPFATDTAWDARAEAVLRAACRSVPRHIPRLSAFVNRENGRALALLERFGFVRGQINHVYHALASRFRLEGASSAVAYEADHRGGLDRLHDRSFPGTWMSTAEMVGCHEAGTGALFVTLDGERLTGYVFVKEDLPELEGSVEFLAVGKEDRGRGLGRALLVAGLDWLFRGKGLELSHLCVSGENLRAHELYESVGLVLEHTGIALDCDLKSFRKTQA